MKKTKMRNESEKKKKNMRRNKYYNKFLPRSLTISIVFLSSSSSYLFWIASFSGWPAAFSIPLHFEKRKTSLWQMICQHLMRTCRFVCISLTHVWTDFHEVVSKCPVIMLYSQNEFIKRKHCNNRIFISLSLFNEESSSLIFLSY